MEKSKKTKKVAKFNRNTLIINSLRRSFPRSPHHKECLTNAISETETGPRGGKMYKCSNCKEAFPIKYIQVDHLESVCPLSIPIKHLSLNVYVKRLFCDVSNLQIICKKCHKSKSKDENKIRRIWKKQYKYIVYKTSNNINHKFYIGVHGTNDYDDGYLGSGVAFKAAVRKYGVHNFTRHIIAVFELEKDAYNLEKDIVTNEFVDSKKCYNLRRGGGYGTGLSFDPKFSGNRKISKGESSFNAKKVRCIETRQIFGSIVDTGITHIERSIKKGTSAGGYHWEYLEYPELNAKELKNITYYKRRVLCVEKNKIYNSIKEASLDTDKKCRSKISAVCRGRRNKAAGYTWKYVDAP